MATNQLEIHPAIGIARVGSSDDFLLGPEPGMAVERNRRDTSGQRRLKRQAARFRVFDCTRDDQGKLTSATELTPATATITWRVHLVNRKAAAPKFLRGGAVNTDPTVRRNGATGNDEDPLDKSLIIDGRAHELRGASQAQAKFAGQFKGAHVRLGSMETDAQGRLIVVGGFGRSASVPASDGAGLNFADNDDWHDDTSDGPVSARVSFSDGRPDQDVEKPAWVIACQPDFAPQLPNLVTLYDALVELAIFTRQLIPVPTFTPAYDQHVRPILERALGYQWVNRFGRAAHGPNGPGDFNSAVFEALGDPAQGETLRQRVFSLLRDPQGPATTPGAPAMPALFSDDYFEPQGRTHVQPLARQQFRILQAWSAGNFTKTGPPPEPELLPEALTRVALEACVGAAYCPGIEAGRKLRDLNIYMPGEPFRFSHTALKPGELTESMALPWQADFAQCRWEPPQVGPARKGRGWWPAQRPDDVFLNAGDAQMQPWDDGASRIPQMIKNWDRLGIVLSTTDPAGNPAFVEEQRTLPRT